MSTNSEDDPKFDEELPDPNDPENQRFRLPHQQMNWLKSKYEQNPHPSPHDVAEMAKKLGMNKRKLRIWFQNRRAVAKRKARN
ncbi:UNVERIFIED_CONTAM: hypothetical protein HDU68_004353 [Siphonaria sp. JEL0065]|nr:hypothetical protein HDU68_004353 [Siphonaria sp. JEL0065]